MVLAKMGIPLLQASCLRQCPEIRKNVVSPSFPGWRWRRAPALWRQSQGLLGQNLLPQEGCEYPWPGLKFPLFAF